MSERINITKARVELSALMAQVTYESKRFVIERHGKPLGAWLVRKTWKV
jgi:PHD/YefM family antitoxin component YafN of YafNO toxin-antitoxin module